MATDKRFAVAGISTHNGETKIRFANDLLRTKVLIKNGHKDVDLVELPYEMTKSQAVQHLISIGFAGTDSLRQLALEQASKKNPAVSTEPANTRTDQVLAPATSAMEDAPF